MRAVGRLMQVLGLTIPPLSIVLQLVQAVSLGLMLTLLVLAVSLFAIGRILEGYARP